jgi:hypothetical protein
MSERETRTRTVLMAYFPMFIATLSLVTSIFNGYLNARFVDIIQRNLGRGEYLRTCKDVIDAYFQIKLKATVISRNRGAPSTSDGSAMTAEQIDGASAVAKLSALGTYLANLRGEAVRARYTELSMAVDRAIAQAGKTPPAEVGKLFAAADTIFAELNGDCVKTATDQQM